MRTLGGISSSVYARVPPLAHPPALSRQIRTSRACTAPRAWKNAALNLTQNMRFFPPARPAASAQNYDT